MSNHVWLVRVIKTKATLKEHERPTFNLLKQRKWEGTFNLLAAIRVLAHALHACPHCWPPEMRAFCTTGMSLLLVCFPGSLVAVGLGSWTARHLAHYTNRGEKSVPNYSTNNASVWSVSKEAFAALAVKMIVSQDFSNPRFLWSPFLDTVLWRQKNACKGSTWKYSSQLHKNPRSLSAATFWLCKMTHSIVCLNLQPASML